MPILLPFVRTVRQLTGGSYKSGWNSNYIKHPDYAKSPERYIHSFLLIQNDLFKLFEYVDPSDKNKLTYSYRIHELFMRVCMEIEANCKAILKENGYTKKPENMNMKDYCLIEKTHKLSEYQVSLPRWEGKFGIYYPFEKWALNEELGWYKYHNYSKHDIHANFKHSNIKNLIEATCGLVALLSSQFLDEDFSGADPKLILEGYGDHMESAIGGIFRVKYPVMKNDERYNFDWVTLKHKANIFQKHDYDRIKIDIKK